jgi:hypothetical protein
MRPRDFVTFLAGAPDWLKAESRFNSVAARRYPEATSLKEISESDNRSAFRTAAKTDPNHLKS